MWIRKIFYRHDTENTAFSEKLPQIKNVFKISQKFNFSRETIGELFKTK